MAQPPAVAVLPDSQLQPRGRTFPVVETMAALLMSAATHSATPVTLPCADPSQTAIITPALRTVRAATSASVGVWRSIKAANMATATGIADLQRSRFQQQSGHDYITCKLGLHTPSIKLGWSKQSKRGFSCRPLSSRHGHLYSMITATGVAFHSAGHIWGPLVPAAQ